MPTQGPVAETSNPRARAEGRGTGSHGALRPATLGYLCLFLLALYLLVYGGRFHIVDEVSIYAMAENLAKRGRLDTDQILWTQWVRAPREVQGAFGRDGHVYSKKGVAGALLPALLVRLGLNFPAIGLTFVAFLSSPLLTALTACFLALYVRRLGYRATTAVVTAVLYGTATLALPYTRMLFGEPAAALGLVAALYALHRSGAEGSRGWAAVAGLAFSFSIWARAVNAMVFPFLAWYHVARLTSAQPAQGWRQRLTARPWLLFALTTVVLGVGGYGAYNVYRFGAPWRTGYQFAQGEFFTTPPWVGLYGLLLSPLRGLVWYTPLFLLSGVGLHRMGQRHRTEARVLTGIVASYILLFSTWWMWWGGFAWGPRFLLPVVPLLVVPLAALWEDVRWRWAVVGLTVPSLGVQALAVLPDFTLAETLLEQRFGSVVSSPALYDPRWSPLVLQARLLAQGFWDVAWVRVGRAAVPTVALAAAVAIAAGLGTWHTAAAETARGERLRKGLRSRALFSSLSIAGLAGGWVLAVALGLRSLSAHARQDPVDAATYEALAEVRSQSTEGDVLITIAPFDYARVMNWSHVSLYTLGLAPHPAPLRPEEARLLEKAARRAEKQIWLLAARIPPGHLEALAERWLSEQAFVVSNRWVGELRLVRFAPPAAPPTHDVAIPGGEAAAVWPERVRFFDWPARPGAMLRVEVQWRVNFPLPGEKVTFVHLLSPQGKYVAGTDTLPVNGYAATSTWKPGQLVKDRKAIALPDTLKAGVYRLEVGLYDPATGQRVPLGRRTEVVVEPVPVEAR